MKCRYGFGVKFKETEVLLSSKGKEILKSVIGNSPPFVINESNIVYVKKG